MKYHAIGSLVLSIKGEMDSDDGATDRETGPNVWGCIVEYSPRMDHYAVEFTNGTSVFIETGELADTESYEVVSPEVMASRMGEVRRYNDRLNEREQAPDGDAYNHILSCIGA